MNNKLYLVTGAAGFLGGTICRQLIERGDKVRAFVLPNDKVAKHIPQDVEIYEGDLCDIESLERFFTVEEGIETVVLHIASIVNLDPDYNQKVMDVNVGGTKNIIDLCLSHKECQKLVYCSSTGAIPELPKGEAIKEVYEFDESKVLGCYSQSKALATQAVLDAAKYRGLDASVVFPSGIFGPKDFATGHTTKLVLEVVNGDMPIGIAGSFNLCDVRDLARGTILAADKGGKGECYILANEEITFKEFSKMLVKESGCKNMKIFIPEGIANFLATIVEKQAKKKGTKPLMTTFSVYNLVRNNTFDSSKAKEELGYTARPYEETLRDQVAWLKKEDKLNIV